VKVKQHTLQSFEFIVSLEDEDKLISYLSQNQPLILGNTVVLTTDDPNLDFKKKIIPFLKENNYCYFVKKCHFASRKRNVLTVDNLLTKEILDNFKINNGDEIDSSSNINKKTEPDIKNDHDEKLENEHKPEQDNKNGNKLKIRELIEKPVRSGSLIFTKNDLTIISQVNGGAEVESEGNIEVFGSISGRVICRGTYMMMRDIGEKGQVIFNGIILDKEKFKNKKIKLLKLNSDKRLLIEEL